MAIQVILSSFLINILNTARIINDLPYRHVIQQNYILRTRM